MLQPSLAYNRLKFSLQMFHHPPAQLKRSEYDQVQSHAEAECILQEKILTSKEAMYIMIPEKSVQNAVAAISGRYESPESFEADMAENDLDLMSMAAALEVELTVEATINQVVAAVEPPSKMEVEKVFQEVNRDKTEQRRLRHILITINDQFPENTRQEALIRINKIQEKVLAPEGDFSELAQRYSECPSALQGGTVGPVSRGRIYPSLEQTLFEMEEGEISTVVESNLGFHILLCEEIIKGDQPTPEETKSKIRKAIHARFQKKAVQSWLAAL